MKADHSPTQSTCGSGNFIAAEAFCEGRLP